MMTIEEIEEKRQHDLRQAESALYVKNIKIARCQAIKQKVLDSFDDEQKKIKIANRFDAMIDKVVIEKTQLESIKEELMAAGEP